MDFIFKTSINSRIFFHWILVICLICVILYHFSSNPIGLSIAIILLIITFLINPISHLILTDNDVIIKKTYGFLYSNNEYIALKNLKRIYLNNFRTNVSGGEWIFTGNYKASVIFYVLSGSYFYQNTSELQFYLDNNEIKTYNVNTSNGQVLKFIKKFEDKIS